MSVVRFRSSHGTRYVFSEPAKACRLDLRLIPRRTPRQNVLHADIAITPRASNQRRWTDAFGNPCVSAVIDGPFRTLEIDAVALTSCSLDHKSEAAFPCDTSLWTTETVRTPALPSLVAAANDIAAAETASHARAAAVVDYVHRRMRYDPGAADPSRALETTVAEEAGVCQDFAHMAAAMLRTLSIPVRYVCGYLDTTAVAGRNAHLAEDDLHAWICAYDLKDGWVDFDPVLGERVDKPRVTVAHGRDFDDVAPVIGRFEGGGAHIMETGVSLWRA
ncbi:MAG: transglutaminase family protein [Pseudomonadota bacterium]